MCLELLGDADLVVAGIDEDHLFTQHCNHIPRSRIRVSIAQLTPSGARACQPVAAALTAIEFHHSGKALADIACRLIEYVERNPEDICGTHTPRQPHEQAVDRALTPVGKEGLV